MSALLYLTGLIIGITIFLYFYSTYQSGREKLSEIKKGRIDPAHISGPNETIEAGPKLTRPPGKRICPLCGKELSGREALIAAELQDTRGSRILIYGCPYCYRPDNTNSDGKPEEVPGA